MVCPRCSLRNPAGTVTCARCGEATPLPVTRALSTTPPGAPLRDGRMPSLDRRARGLPNIGSFAPPVRPPVRARPRTVREHPAARQPMRTPRIAAAPVRAEELSPPLPSTVHQAKTDPAFIVAPVRPVEQRRPVSIVEPPHAPLARRFAAGAIDAGVVLATVVVGWLLAALALGPGALSVHFEQGVDAGLDALIFRRQLGVLSLALATATAMTQATLALALCGATFGQQLMRLRVAFPDDRRPTPGEALIRTLAAAALLVPGALTFASAVFDPRRRTLHDRLLGSRVVALEAASDED